MSDVLPSPAPCHNSSLKRAPSNHNGIRRDCSRSSNNSFAQAASDPLPRKRKCTSSHSSPPAGPPVTQKPCPVPSHSPNAAPPANPPGPQAALTCVSPGSDPGVASQGSHPGTPSRLFANNAQSRNLFVGQKLTDLPGSAVPGEPHDSTLPRLIALFGEGPPAENQVGVFGQAILVASRLGAYSRAAWNLLLDAEQYRSSDGNVRATAGSSPLTRYCESLKTLVRHSILKRVGGLHTLAAESPKAARSLLHHILLWQYLKRRSIMELVALVLQSETARGDGSAGCSANNNYVAAVAGDPMHFAGGGGHVADGGGVHGVAGGSWELGSDGPGYGGEGGEGEGCFLLHVGVPLLQDAMEKARTSAHTSRGPPSSIANPSNIARPAEAEMDVASVMRMVYKSAQLPSPSCTESAVSALSGDADSLHRVAAFLSQHHALVTQILSGVDHTPQQLLLLYLSITSASALLTQSTAPAPPAQEPPALVEARAAIAAYNAVADSRQRAAKAAILDARISAAKSAAWNKDVAACTVKAAVAKAFRDVYLFAELKDLLASWSRMLDDSLDPSALPPSAALAASAAASTAFDISDVGLRFRVPSAGFLLVWTTSPSSPAHELDAASAAAWAEEGGEGGPRRKSWSDVTAAATGVKRNPAALRASQSDDVLVQVEGAPAGRQTERRGGKVGDMGPPPSVLEGGRRPAVEAGASAEAVQRGPPDGQL